MGFTSVKLNDSQYITDPVGVPKSKSVDPRPGPNGACMAQSNYVIFSRHGNACPTSTMQFTFMFLINVSMLYLFVPSAS
ncbi:hypothetical protein Hanom_Chr15g01345531 [Helianthus anomalus]